MSKFETVLRLIDEANSADPTLENGAPAALLYGKRMSAQLRDYMPDAGDLLHIAARGQHIERWLLPRDDYPAGKAGYLAWRQEQARRHANRVAGIMADAGYDSDSITRTGSLLRKERLEQDPEVQALEDVICLVFMAFYFADFAQKHSSEALFKIIQKTGRKISSRCRDMILERHRLPEELEGALML